ncbi:MAG: TlpA family protein disulfide reductase [Clostridiales bacterium]|nr:TlpA family protein disulfide reductase [Clostridiales bacterium]
MKNKMMFLLLILVITSLILSGCIGGKAPDENVNIDVENDDEEVVETISRDNIGTIDGITLDDIEVNNDIIKENDLTMINIWATFCPPCIEEMPDLGEINREYDNEGKKFAIIGVVTDVADMAGNINEDTLELANEIIELTGADYTHIIPGDEFIKSYLYKVSVIPTTVFVNNEGEILKTVVGANTKAKWIDIIDEVMAEI